MGEPSSLCFSKPLRGLRDIASSIEHHSDVIVGQWANWIELDGVIQMLPRGLPLAQLNLCTLQIVQGEHLGVSRIGARYEPDQMLPPGLGANLDKEPLRALF
ncbi:MAG TPA: hypothetical protein VHY79_17670 [Rhizomicrobium sp.]|nr:hypothetical protein [Rhizomicrobium sp.]